VNDESIDMGERIETRHAVETADHESGTTGTDLAEPREAWVAREQAIELTGLSQRSLYRHIAEECWRTRPSSQCSANGRPVPEIAVSSLPASAQALYWSKQLLPSVVDSVSDPLNLAEIPECLRVEAHRRLTILDAAQPIFEQPRGLRKAVLAQFCADREISTGTLHNWRAAYQRGGLPALLPQWGKTRGTFLAISDAVHDFLKAEHCSPKRPDRTTLYRFLRTFCGSIHEPCPSQSTVNKFLNSLPPPAVILAREGNQAWRAQCEPKCERDLSDLLVGEWWVSDHREFDVFVQLPWWNHVTREMEYKIFRPWLTAWLDLRSRALVGYVVCMNPSSESIACALRDGILKHGLPAHLYRDRGKDYKANWWGGKYITHRNVKLSDDAMLLLKPGVISEPGIQLHAAKAYTPWAKPIEGWFGRTFPQWERTLPGWCGSDNKERPEKLAGEIARRELLTLDAFTQRVGD
jgi:putative transposase